MKRDRILAEKDRVQKKLWIEAGKSVSGYVKLVHQKAVELGKVGLKIKCA